ncbi:MAG: hypothetical protein ETSY1_38750 [Candidatus Entotheonella factor]|uniref:NAD-dependent epimerase/dehydratase domain-containing protein n=2 Tax=Candidatus Entotheonella TaxID=93171 RepID=W4L862_ENTF1|nr:MAG: hypothetical protein ETSY1_38750 [Candidatus Entotheonella factor]
MQILMLGGTRFLGCHLVEAALNQGHEVTLFNRGQTHPGWFAQVERLQGDRDGDLSALEGRHWDAVIDTCGYVPRLVRASAELLAARVEHYTFISTASVYADPSRHGMDEESPVGTLEDERLEDVNGNTYGPLKVLCEQAAEAAMPGRVLTIRSGLIVGPFDPSDRFTYWPVRIAQGGEVLAPAGPGKRIELIDVRDLAEWIVRMAGARATGIYNASGAREALTMGYLLDECRDLSAADARITWVSEAFLKANGVEPFSDMPLWEPEGEDGLATINASKALNAGLTLRPLADTIRDTLAWHRTRPQDTPLTKGIGHEREQALLQTWHAQAAAEPCPST